MRQCPVIRCLRLETPIYAGNYGIWAKTPLRWVIDFNILWESIFANLILSKIKFFLQLSFIPFLGYFVNRGFFLSEREGREAGREERVFFGVIIYKVLYQ